MTAFTTGGYPQKSQSLRSPSIDINWRHPLAAHLIGAWTPGISQGIDLTGRNPPATSNPSIYALSTGVEGPGMSCTATNTGVSVVIGANSPLISFNQQTMYWRGVQLGAPATSNGAFFGTTYSSPNAAPFTGMIMNVDGSGHYALAFQASPTTNGSVVTTVNIFSAGTTFSLASTYLVGGGTNGVILYINGVNSNTGTPTPSVSTVVGSATSAFNIGGDITNTANNCNALMYVGYVFNRVLSPSEIVYLDANPYSLLMPATSIYFPTFQFAPTILLSVPRNETFLQYSNKMVGY